MAQQNLNTSTPNDGLGDALRAAFVKVNAMFTELYSSKVPTEVGKGLSANDFTSILKTKLDSIESYAEVNVQSDWAQADNTADNFIKNKPSIPVLGDYLLQGSYVGDADNLLQDSKNYTDLIVGFNRLLSGFVITPGNTTTATAATWRINGITYAKATTSTFVNISLSAAGLFRYVAFYGLTDNTVEKVEGAQLPIFEIPSSVVPNKALLGYILVGDAAYQNQTLPDNGFALNSDKSNDVADSASTTKFPVWAAIVTYITNILATFKTTNFLDATSSIQTQINGKQPSGNYASGVTNTGDETASTIINKIGDGSTINQTYLPSYVDDVLEFANLAAFPATGDAGKIYIALNPSSKQYRWSGSAYIQITNGLIGSTNDISEGGSNLYFTNARAKTAVTFEVGFAVSDEATDLASGTAKGTFRTPVAFNVANLYASVNTAPTGSTIVVNIKKNGTTIFTTKLSIASGSKTSVGGTSYVLTTTPTAFAIDDEITIDIDQVGAVTAGKGLKVFIVGTRL